MGSVQELSIIKGGQRDFKFQPLHRILEENISGGSGNKPAIIYTDQLKVEQRISYDALNGSANRLAGMLLQQIADRQLQPNQDGDWIIAVCMMPSHELLITLLSIWKTGAAYLPIDPSFPLNRIEHILQESKPVLIIYDQLNVDPTLFAGSNAISFANCQRAALSFAETNICTDRTLTGDKGSALLGLVLYTSGSTGVPKGKKKTYKNKPISNVSRQ